MPQVVSIYLISLRNRGSDGQSRESNKQIWREAKLELWRLVSRKDRKMPEKSTVEKAKEDLREGKSPSTAAGEFVHEEIEHVREGKHGARSPQQAIAIGLSKARRAGIPLKPPRRGRASASTRKRAARDYRRGRTSSRRQPSRRRSRARERALKREPHSSASHSALSRQARNATRRRGRANRSRAGRRAAATRSHRGTRRHRAAR
jgi:hypothetical protein